MCRYEKDLSFLLAAVAFITAGCQKDNMHDPQREENGFKAQFPSVLRCKNGRGSAGHLQSLLGFCLPQ